MSATPVNAIFQGNRVLGLDRPPWGPPQAPSGGLRNELTRRDRIISLDGFTQLGGVTARAGAASAATFANARPHACATNGVVSTGSSCPACATKTSNSTGS